MAAAAGLSITLDPSLEVLLHPGGGFRNERQANSTQSSADRRIYRPLLGELDCATRPTAWGLREARC